MNLTAPSKLPQAYAAILFLHHPLAGLVIAAITFLYPNIGAAGLLAAIVSLILTRLWKFPDYSSHVQIFNSLLVGLSLGAFYEMNIYVIGIIILGAILTTFIATVLADWMWRMDRLPIMSLPFVIVAGFMALVARNYTALNDYLGFTQVDYTLFTPAIDAFFSSMGAIFFIPQPLAGLLLFALLVLQSRYLGLLAILGYITGHTLLTALLFEPHSGFIVWTSFNFMLTAIALGGIFIIPSMAGLLFAMVGVLLSALIVVAVKDLILVQGLPVMAISFVVTTLTLLIAMKKRIGLMKPYLAPEPGLPEINYEKARLAKYRYGDINSVPLLAPVFGNWTIYQGFNGNHSHKAPWQHALDFIITHQEKSFANYGTRLDDYYCFGAPVLSPAYGEVVRTYDRLPDNIPGEVDTKNNWGNFLIIRLDSGLHLMLAHLQQGSIKVKEKERVQPGKVLAACGNSGRSPQPHLHMQVQNDAQLDSRTFPFHLCSMMLHKTDGSTEYQVVYLPEQGEQIEPTTPDDQLANLLHLPVGRQMKYQLSCKHSSKIQQRTLIVKLTLLGQFRLTSDTEASSAFEETNGVLAFYDRKGHKDILLNMLVLAIGLTPLTEIAHQWQDSPSARLLPLTIWDKLWLSLLRPLGCGLQSKYERRWDSDKSQWAQQATHTLKVGAIHKTAQTCVVIDPEFGCRDITLNFDGKSWRAELSETGLIEDQGIPQWQVPTPIQNKSKPETRNEVVISH